MPDPLEDDALGAGRGDEAATQRLVEATHRDVWRLCAYLVDEQTADDLTQETFLRACRSLPGFRGDSPVRSWLLTIARRVCAAEIDRRVRQREVTIDVAPQAWAAAALPDHADGTDLSLLLARLEPDRRAAFVLTQVIGCDYAEAAEVCGCPLGTIRSRVARARADLVAALAEQPLSTSRSVFRHT